MWMFHPARPQSLGAFAMPLVQAAKRSKARLGATVPTVRLQEQLERKEPYERVAQDAEFIAVGEPEINMAPVRNTNRGHPKRNFETLPEHQMERLVEPSVNESQRAWLRRPGNTAYPPLLP